MILHNSYLGSLNLCALLQNTVRQYRPIIIHVNNIHECINKCTNSRGKY